MAYFKPNRPVPRSIPALFMRPMIFSLVFLLIIGTLAPVFNTFAQEMPTGESPGGTQDSSAEADIEPTVAEPTTNIPSNSSEPVLEEENPEEKLVEDKLDGEEIPEPESSNSVVGPLNQQGEISESTSRLSPEVDNTTGALSYSYKISVPPGRNQMTPHVKLVYDSASSSRDSIFGLGWAVDIPFIERVNRDGSDKLYTENYFVSSLDGELISLGSGIFSAKDESGNFHAYTLASNSWTIKDKAGTVYIFGNMPAARQDNPSDGSKVFKWMLEEVRDTNGNYIKYEYYKNAGQIYPSKVTYTGNGTTDGVLEVNFERENRTDGASFFNAGFPVKSNYRISEIRTEVNNVWARKYTLAYATADNGTTSLLNSIVESGQDDSSNVVVLPAIDFDYATAATDWTYNSSWNLPLAFIYSGQDFGMRTTDINGDGLTDILCHNDNMTGSPCNRSNPEIHLNNGNGFTDVSSTWLFPLDAGGSGRRETFVDSAYLDMGLRAIDINGDLKTDLVRGDGPTKYTYINNGTGWTYDSSWNLPTYFHWTGIDRGMRMGDINGDGLPDIVCHNETTSTGDCPKNTPRIWLNNGAGFTEVSSTWVFPAQVNDNTKTEAFLGNSLEDRGVRLLDVNGDNLADLVRADGSIRYTYINNGTGWTYDSSWNLPIPYINGADDSGVRMSDFNADGLVDILCHTANTSGSCGISNPKTYINTGAGWSDVSSTWVFPPKAWDTSKTEVFLDSTYADEGLQVMDINGDGLDDLVRGNGSSNKYTYLNNEDVASNLLTQITYQQGGNSVITYKATPQFKDGSNNLLNPAMPTVAHVVSQIIDSDGLGLSQTSNLEYQGGAHYFNNYLDRKFAGFSKATNTDAAGNKVVNYFHQGNSTDSSNGEYSDHVSKIGRIYRTEVKDSSGNIYSKSINKWDRYQIASDRNFVKLAQTLELSYDSDSDHKDSASSYTYSDTTGNTIEVVNWGEVTGVDAGTFTDTGTDKLSTTISYASNTGANISGLPSQETTLNQGSVKVRENKYYYDTQSLGSVTDGNLTKQEMWKTGSSYVDIETSYNTTYGLVTQEKDARDKATNYTYDSLNLFPATVTNPLSQATGYIYDYSSGQVKQLTDSNAQVFSTVYDGLDRVLEVKEPDLGTPPTIVTKTSYAYTDTSGAVKVKKIDHLDASTNIETYSYQDGLAREIQVRREMEDSNTFVTIDTVYNNAGQVHKSSLPYSSTGTNKTSPTITATLLSTNSYDAAGRITIVANAAGTTTTSYDDWKTTVVDANGKTRRLFKDAHRNLVKVEEVNGANTYTTLYEYDGNNSLTKITDALGNVRNFTYDGLGRRLTAQDLHASADATFGSWSYSYDDAGNLTSTTDPKGQVVNSTYDDLNRTLTVDYAGLAGTEVANAYDSCPGGVGKLCSTANSAATETYEYNAVGGTKKETKTISSVPYVTQYDYDRQGNQTLLTYPDNSQAKYLYNAAGMLESVQRKESADGSFSSLATDYDYNPAGKVTYQANANGTATTNTYDSAKLYRLSNKSTTIPGGNKAQDLTYTYDNVGNITRIVDNSNTNTRKTVDYTYDDLHRLLTATATNAINGQNYAQTYSYDAIGNITNKSDVGAYSYLGNQGASYANPHAVTAAGTGTYAYDNNGNLVTTTVGGGGGGGAISPDATTTSITNGYVGTTTKTWTHTTTSGTNRLLVLSADIWQDAPGTGSITAASYNGVAMTKATSIRSGGMQSELWYLANPASGANTVSVTVTGATDSIKLAASTFTGVDQASPFVASNTATGSSGNPTVSRTTTVANSLVTATLARFSTTSAATNRTSLYNNATGSTLGAASYQVAAATGSYSDTYTGSASSDWSMVMAEFRPASGGGGGGTTTTNTWDYNNRLTQTVAGTSTVTYSYDSSGQRTRYANGTTTTTYPNRYYNTDGTTVTKHIFDGEGNVLSTVQTTSGGGGTGTIAPDATSTSITNGYVGTTTKTWSHTTSSGSNRLLVLSADIWQDTPGTGSITAASYNGVAMTKVTSIRSGGMQSEVWYLINPVSGSNTMSVTVTGATDSIKLAASTFTGAAQSSVVYASATSTGTSGNPTVSVTTTATNDLVVATLSRFTNTAATTNRTSLYNNATGSTLGAASYQLATAPGAYSDTYTGSASADRSMVAVAFKAASGGGGGGTTTVVYGHTDHLTGSNAMTNSSGVVIELMDYYPFGSIRLDEKAASFSEQRKYTGQEYDVDTGLYYMNARYQNPAIGRFASQDPVFLALGDNALVKQMTDQELMQILSDPQNLNSYAYGRNNPLSFQDPTGQWSINVFAVLPNSWQVGIGNAANNAYNNNAVARYSLDHPYQAGAAIGVLGGAAVAGGVVAAGGSITCGLLCGSAAVTTATTAGPVVASQGNKAETLLNVGIKEAAKIDAQRAAVINQAMKTGESEVVRIANRLFKPFDTVPGGTAGAYKFEQQTGKLLSPTGHGQAAKNTISWINNTIGNVNNSGKNLLNSFKKGLERVTRTQY